MIAKNLVGSATVSIIELPGQVTKRVREINKLPKLENIGG